MSLEDESRRIVQELLAVFPDLEPEVRHDLDLVYAVAGSTAAANPRRTRRPVRRGLPGAVRGRRV